MDSSIEPDEEEEEDVGEISEEAEVCVSDLCGNLLVLIGKLENIICTNMCCKVCVMKEYKPFMKEFL